MGIIILRPVHIWPVCTAASPASVERAFWKTSSRPAFDQCSQQMAAIADLCCQNTIAQWGDSCINIASVFFFFFYSAHWVEKNKQKLPVCTKLKKGIPFTLGDFLSFPVVPLGQDVNKNDRLAGALSLPFSTQTRKTVSYACILMVYNYPFDIDSILKRQGSTFPSI